MKVIPNDHVRIIEVELELERRNDDRTAPKEVAEDLEPRLPLHIAALQASHQWGTANRPPLRGCE